MENEILKQKYRNLRSRLYNIRNKLNDLLDTHNSTYRNLREAIIINNQIIEEDEIFEMKKSIQHTLNELNNNVIPNVNNKI